MLNKIVKLREVSPWWYGTLTEYSQGKIDTLLPYLNTSLCRFGKSDTNTKNYEFIAIFAVIRSGHLDFLHALACSQSVGVAWAPSEDVAAESDGVTTYLFRAINARERTRSSMGCRWVWMCVCVTDKNLCFTLFSLSRRRVKSNHHSSQRALSHRTLTFNFSHSILVSVFNRFELPSDVNTDANPYEVLLVTEAYQSPFYCLMKES